MNMNAKKRVNGSWVNTTLRQYKTATDTITTFPAVLYTTGTTATVGLKGQAVQSGTPIPDTPIMPQGTGERTGNLFDFATMANGTLGYYLSDDGVEHSSGSWAITDYIPCNGTEFTLNAVGGNEPSICLYNADKQYITGKKYNSGTASTKIAVSLSSQETAKYIRFSWYRYNDASYDDVSKIMLNTGSTALPYEPYGVKIPISSANTTTPIYLGEVQTTRKIKKLVLTGEETWFLYSANNIHQFYTQGNRIGGVASSSAYSTIAPYGMTANNRNGNYGCYTVTNGDEIAFQMYGSRVDIPTQTEWKAYLAAQYAAGTPVTVWYVLATPETGIINEPLMKIGDYADEVSNISIPTITGKNIVDVETVLKPSEVSFNYAGWHTAVVHKRINGAWD